MLKKYRRSIFLFGMVVSIAASVFVFASTRSTKVTGRENSAIPRRLPDVETDSSASSVRKSNRTLPQGSQPAGAVQIVKFALYDAGIFPKEARVSTGLVAISFVDNSGASQGLNVENDAGVRLAHLPRVAGQWRGNGHIRLARGRYRVFDISQPTHWAILIVE